jgi:hypothetical protein
VRRAKARAGAHRADREVDAKREVGRFAPACGAHVGASVRDELGTHVGVSAARDVREPFATAHGPHVGANRAPGARQLEMP